MQVAAAIDVAWWERVVGLSHEASVRAPDSPFQQLRAKENPFREVESVGLLHSTRTYDIDTVTFSGVSPAPLAAGR